MGILMAIAILLSGIGIPFAWIFVPTGINWIYRVGYCELY